jgi:hypothetical protein
MLAQVINRGEREMTLTLEMPSDIKSSLETKAARLGLSLDIYVLEVLRRDAELSCPTHNLQTRQEARRKLEELASGTRAGLSPIPDEALSSESIYAGRGE